MKIGLFLGSVGSNSGGPERYETELVRHLAELDQANEYEVLTLFGNAPERLVQPENFKFTPLTPSIRPVSMLTSLPRLMRKAGADVWHATYVPPPFSPQDYIYSLVCSSMIEQPELYPTAVRIRLQTLTNRAIAKADTILCVSDHIRQVVRERYGVSEDRMPVIYLGASDIFRPVDKAEAFKFVSEKYGLTRPYFLFTGRYEPRKNVVRVIEAFARFRAESGLDMQLVMNGERTWAAEQVDEAIRRHDLQDHVLEVGKSPFEELPYFYSGAVALAYPSLWEGFGLPIVEAMACGTPVITSNNSSMKEIGADAALLVEPESVDDIAAAMCAVAGDTELQARLSADGLARSAPFTWRNTAQQTLALYTQRSAPLSNIA